MLCFPLRVFHLPLPLSELPESQLPQSREFHLPSASSMNPGGCGAKTHCEVWSQLQQWFWGGGEFQTLEDGNNSPNTPPDQKHFLLRELLNNTMQKLRFSRIIP